MASVQDVRNLVSSYISGEISASDLANSFTPILKAAISSKDLAFKDVALAVHAQVAGFFNGLISEEALLANLKPIGDLAKQGLVSFSYQVVNVIESQPVASNPGFSTVVFPEVALTA
jgi:hypothetical protein